MNRKQDTCVNCRTSSIVGRFVGRWSLVILLSLAIPLGLAIVVVIGSDAVLAQTDAVKPGNWISLFDGKSLAGWKITEFGGEGAVAVEQRKLVLGIGSPLTGVTYRGSVELPQFDYEVRLEARRVDGTDFFCGLTFPYRTSHCTLILGGWGGGLVGLSSLAGLDASENETTSYHTFKANQWYDVRLRVRDGTIYAWIDGKQCIVCAVRGRVVDTRAEVIRSKPLGLACFQTKAEIRNVRLKHLPPLKANGGEITDD